MATWTRHRCSCQTAQCTDLFCSDQQSVRNDSKPYLGSTHPRDISTHPRILIFISNPLSLLRALVPGNLKLLVGPTGATFCENSASTTVPLCFSSILKSLMGNSSARLDDDTTNPGRTVRAPRTFSVLRFFSLSGQPLSVVLHEE